MSPKLVTSVSVVRQGRDGGGPPRRLKMTACVGIRGESGDRTPGCLLPPGVCDVWHAICLDLSISVSHLTLVSLATHMVGLV
jgi:hypothetical protein